MDRCLHVHMDTHPTTTVTSMSPYATFGGGDQNNDSYFSIRKRWKEILWHFAEPTFIFLSFDLFSWHQLRHLGVSFLSRDSSTSLDTRNRSMFVRFWWWQNKHTSYSPLYCHFNPFPLELREEQNQLVQVGYPVFPLTPKWGYNTLSNDEIPLEKNWKGHKLLYCLC